MLLQTFTFTTKIGQNCHLEITQNSKNLWELGMIRSTSEAICETVGSIKNQHAGKNCHLEPEYFSMELVLRFSLGPIHLLDDFVDEILSSDTGKTYIFEIGDKTRSSH